jgi:hypothetical protein
MPATGVLVSPLVLPFAKASDVPGTDASIDVRGPAYSRVITTEERKKFWI